MAELVMPFQRLWEWVDRVGGYPGKIVFVCVVIMAILGALTWFGNRK